MIAFGGTFLPGGLRVTVKDAGASLLQVIQFNGRGIGEFTAVISQKDAEDLLKRVSSDTGVDTIKDVDDGLRIVVIPKESQHKLSFDEM